MRYRRYHTQVEGTKGSIVKDGFVGADECIADALLQRSLGGGFKLFQPFLQDIRLDSGVHFAYCPMCGYSAAQEIGRFRLQLRTT